MRTYEELCDLLCDLGYENVVVFRAPSYSEAAIGISNDGRVVYDYDLMVEHLVREGICEDDIDAADFISYEDSFSQHGFPIIYDRLYDEEMKECINEGIQGAEEYEPIVFKTFQELQKMNDKKLIKNNYKKY